MPPRKECKPRKTILAMLVLAVFVYCAYLRAARQVMSYEFSGQTMGTSYSVTISHTRLSTRKARTLHEKVENLLERINLEMSTYDARSEISRFNRSKTTNAFDVSPGFITVTELALKVAHQSRGAFDPTIMPLLSLWGFGPGGERGGVPDRDAVEARKEIVGFMKLRVVGPRSLQKTHPQIAVDLSAAAKGYAADRIARLACDSGYPNVFVEIGGEIMALGSSGDNRPWRVSIDRPDHDTVPGESSVRTLELENRAVATSGDYRNYYGDHGRVYSHIIDPRSGYPVSNRVASTTVIAADCMTADALATALTVLGPQAGLHLLEAFPSATAMWIVRRSDGSFEEHYSPGFPASSD